MGEVRSVLVVDDDDAHRDMLVRVLRGQVSHVLTAASGDAALALLEREHPTLILLDMRMPGLDGMATLERMRARGLTIPTVVVTAFAEVEDAVRAMKLGAIDYLAKPIDLQTLASLVESHVGRPATPIASEYPPLPPGIVFASPLMQQVLREIALVAKNRAAVLLTGESGTGKEVLARLVHEWSDRKDHPLVSVNVAALPEQLIESELFGHVKGAFTGADRERAGEFERARGGTLFLDEIGELPLLLQPKLLRVLETQRVRKVGGDREAAVDFRLLAATNRDLEARIEAGTFRADLYYRLAVFTIEVPPLRERPEDVLPLAQAMLRSLTGKRLSPAAEEALLAHRWPGNVRELSNSLQRASILAPGEWILPEHLPRTVRARPSDERPAPSPTVLADIEREAIFAALRRCDGNRSKAARELGISRRKLLYRLKDYGESG